ncbi:MAG: helix-turn-helix transcriptional regulator [Cyclobacteriaceae bacterium]
MKKIRLGEFQELILMAVIVLQKEAYGNEIQRELEERLSERLSMGAIQTALKRMEERGFITSEWGEPTQKRGGKRKRIYTATPHAYKTLHEIKDIRTHLWHSMPEIDLGSI